MEKSGIERGLTIGSETIQERRRSFRPTSDLT